MIRTFHKGEGVWWLFDQPGGEYHSVARAHISEDAKTIVIFDFWTHGPEQGKGYAKKLLEHVRSEFSRVIIQGIGDDKEEAAKRAATFWEKMYNLELVDELHYQDMDCFQGKKPVIRCVVSDG